MTRPTLLVDGNNLLYRAVEATRRSAMNAPDGTSTSALVVFTSTLSRYIREEKPYRVMICWDAGYGWRTRLHPGYKAARPQHTDDYRSTSRDLVTGFLQRCRIPQARVDGFEADDLIAAYWRALDAPITILSNDKDMLQMVGPNPAGQPCEQIRISSADTPTDRWDEAKVIEHFGCTPAQLPIAMSLAGDPGDGVPGVSGIGMKTAVKHLAKADWDLSAITHPGIAAARDSGEIEVYRQLVDLRDTPTPVVLPLSVAPFIPVTPGPDDAWRDLYGFLSRYGMTRTINRLASGELW
ncbi:5'-3' exonuclease [Streptomyces sp. V3I8]|uniref:5'-3' exonuclease n=1 Tax=Streptomyces sp. V3I8 TaxID=3042279 RepID=UPI002789471E|nr:hypothetical protein [Streptomyces sp. V3I8]MDQ1041425.1 5'-3' exonuclease [Streptomyces sp. V3I8]